MKVNGFLAPALRYLVLIALALASLGAIAQDYPARSVRLIVSALPGSSPDLTARILAEQIRKGDIRALFAEAEGKEEVATQYKNMFMQPQTSGSPEEFRKFVDSRIDSYKELAERS